MKTVILPDSKRVRPSLAKASEVWKSKSARTREVAALRLAIDLGMSLIDTAEMYGTAGRRGLSPKRSTDNTKALFVVTKVYPYNASSAELPKACERSLKRLHIDAIDLYLLHWRDETPPLQETVDAFEKLRAAGKIKRWSVSNFDVDDMEELLSLDTVASAPQIRFCTISGIAKSSSIFCRGAKRTRSRSWRIRPSVTAANCSETQR